MNDSTRVMRPPRRAWPPAARTAAAIIAAAGLALPAAAFGGSPSSTAPAARRMRERQRAPSRPAPSCSPSPAACARTACRNSPTPTQRGQTQVPSLRELGVSSSQFEAAEKACQTCSRPAPTTSSPGRGAAAADRHAEVQPVHAPATGCRTGPTRPPIPRAAPSSRSRHVPGTDRSYWRSPRITSQEQKCRTPAAERASEGFRLASRRRSPRCCLARRSGSRRERRAAPCGERAARPASGRGRPVRFVCLAASRLLVAVVAVVAAALLVVRSVRRWRQVGRLV